MSTIIDEYRSDPFYMKLERGFTRSTTSIADQLIVHALSGLNINHNFFGSALVDADRYYNVTHSLTHSITRILHYTMSGPRARYSTDDHEGPVSVYNNTDHIIHEFLYNHSNHKVTIRVRPYKKHNPTKIEIPPHSYACVCKPENFEKVLQSLIINKTALIGNYLLISSEARLYFFPIDPPDALSLA